MTPSQRFRQGNKEKSLAVRKDKVTGDFYSRITDIQRIFPNAAEFEVKGVILNFLEDEHEQEQVKGWYDPKRIAHYPHDTVDIVFASSIPASSNSLSGARLSQTSTGNPCHPSQSLSVESSGLTVSNLSQHHLPHATTNALVRSPPSSSSASSNLIALQTTSLARPKAMLSEMELGIAHLRQQIERSSDRHSVHHQQQMHRLTDMVAQMNSMLQEQAASKEREERMLQEQTESKLRKEQMLKMQQETIDRLIVNQQRVDAILVQNYELHEYPIPRLFVVLPDSFGDWDPRNFLMERFRLHFLCECSDDCDPNSRQSASSDKLDITAGNTTNPIPVKNSIHLAKHDGYELSRPTEFFHQYGPYVLGMLRILQHCLAVTAVATPIAALADNGLKNIMGGVKLISMSTMEAVGMSINILETTLVGTDVANGIATTSSNGQEDSTMFENLVALEGADLRRLDTFLRNNDQDKTLGNLYRITTEQGHVKWVCFEHYQEKYRATALSSFIQSVESAGGVYYPHLGQVTVGLKSGTTSKDFFRRLARQAPAVQTLDVTLDWDLASTDLATLVDMVAKSNVKDLKLNLQYDHTSNPRAATWRPGKGRYHSLIGLLSNTKLRSLQFSNLYLLGTRTSKLPSSLTASWLQSFRFFGRINVEDRIRLTNIISNCSQLVDLRLVCQGWGYLDLGLHQAVFSLKKLKRLHLAAWKRDDKWNGNEWTFLEGDQPMTEVICCNQFLDSQYLNKVIQQSSAVLEVLVVHPCCEAIDITSGSASFTPNFIGSEEATSTERLLSRLHLSALTHLDLQVRLTDYSLQYLSTLLPGLNLVHFGCNEDTHELLRHCNPASLKSLSILEGYAFNLAHILDAMIDGTASLSCSKLEQLFLHDLRSAHNVPTKFLQAIRLNRLFLDYLNPEPLAQLLEVVDLSKLEEISIRHSYYLVNTEKALAKRIDEFSEALVIQLDEFSSNWYTDHDGKSRTTEGSPELLPHHRVTRMDDDSIEEHTYRFLKPILPVYSF